MPDIAIKRRVADAKSRAKSKCRDMDYDIINSDNEIFCFIASRAGIYERKIRVVVDGITQRDIDLIKRFRIPSNQTKEIWCRPYKSSHWEKVAFDCTNTEIECQ